MDIENLRFQQIVKPVDLKSTLQSVQLNPTEMCNRTCVFCPRHDPNLYKNSKKHMSPESCIIIGQQLSEMDFKGRIAFVGFGEPLLNPMLAECIRAVKDNCPTAHWIEINTNGDFLTKEVIIELKNSGCTDIAISMYDKDDTEKYNQMFEGIDIRYILRHQYDASKNYNLNIVDRIGIVKGLKKHDNQRPCYIPFYKLFIDWNGDYLLCDQDWAKVTKKHNIKETKIIDFWNKKLNEYRRNLIVGDRAANNPCKNCDINGLIRGKDSFDIISRELL